MKPDTTQPLLFDLPPPSAPESRQTREKGPTSAPDALNVSWHGQSYALDNAALDALERDCGPCEDENGVSLWRILRDVKASGARRVQFI